MFETLNIIKFAKSEIGKDKRGIIPLKVSEGTAR